MGPEEERDYAFVKARRAVEEGRSLSEELSGRDFLLVYGTTEKVGGRQKAVSTGTPFTCDINNNILVVYDEQGRPWIKRGGLNRSDGTWFEAYGVSRGAYVPHSNDGGEFARQMFERSSHPALAPERKVYGLMQVVERFMAISQNMEVPAPSPLAQSLDEMAKLYEKAKLIYRAGDEAELQAALREL